MFQGFCFVFFSSMGFLWTDRDVFDQFIFFRITSAVARSLEGTELRRPRLRGVRPDAMLLCSTPSPDQPFSLAELS